MLIFETTNSLNAHLESIKDLNLQIGFVPTMGALHEGHLSLINQSKAQNLYTICSIFVNPTQFNDKTDLVNYPRTLEKDITLLNQTSCDVLFAPSSVLEIYPKEDNRTFNFGTLETLLEGKYRPGHFNGVAKVVSILFEIVKPHFAFFGKKDYQQVLIIKALTKQLNLDVVIKTCDIIRENDGLAMSSRNTRLSTEERLAASIIPKVMQQALVLKKQGYSVSALKEFVYNTIHQNPLLKIDYFEISNPNNLHILTEITPETDAVALIACFSGKIRLIDNLNI